MAEQDTFEGWAILELMGHRRLAGYVREATLAGGSFIRIDWTDAEGQAATQFYSPNAVYAITPTTQDTAEAVAKAAYEQPINRWEVRQLAAAHDGRLVDFESEERGF